MNLYTFCISVHFLYTWSVLIFIDFKQFSTLFTGAYESGEETTNVNTEVKLFICKHHTNKSDENKRKILRLHTSDGTPSKSGYAEPITDESVHEFKNIIESIEQKTKDNEDVTLKELTKHVMPHFILVPIDGLHRLQVCLKLLRKNSSFNPGNFKVTFYVCTKPKSGK